MTISIRVLPRFPASIRGSNSIKVIRNVGSADLVVMPDYGAVTQVPAVIDPDDAFFLVWQEAEDMYVRMSFNDVFSAVSGLGFMEKSVYDPTDIEADAFARENHTGSQAISTVTGLQTALNSLTSSVNSKADAAATTTALAGKAPKSVYAAKAANYTALASDAGATLRFTGPATLALTAAATLANGWVLDVVADGGAVTIDPNGAETINGLATWIIPNGSVARIICDGSNFFTTVKPVVWEPVQGGKFTGSGVSSFALANLGAYSRLRITGTMYASASGVPINLQSSTNNGSSYDGAVSDYTYQYFVSSSTTNSGVAATSPGLQIIASSNPNANDAANIDLLISRFNEAQYMQVLNRGGGQDPSNIYLTHFFGRRQQATARNALRFLPNSGTFTYDLKVEGSLI